MHPIIEMFDLQFSSFLLFVYLGFWAGLSFGWYRLRKEKTPRHFFFHIICLIFGGAFVGAKTYFIIEHFEVFLENPSGVFFSLAGSGWFGGFLLCMVLLILYFRIRQLPFLYFADIIVPAVPLGIIFGRMGCFLAGDGCYGVPSDLPWGMSFPNGVVPTLLSVHPTQLYEVLANIIIFVCLIRLREWDKTSFLGRLYNKLFSYNKINPSAHVNISHSLNKSKAADGYVLAVYFILSAIARFFVEFIRLSSVVLWGLTAPQLISICLFAIGGFLLFRVRFSLWLFNPRSHFQELNTREGECHAQ